MVDTQAGRAAHHPPGARGLERIPLDLPATFVAPEGAIRPGRVMNLSARGLFLGTKDVSPIGSPVAVTLALPFAAGAQPLHVATRVRWVNGRSAFSPKVPPGMGLEFVDLEPAAEELLRRFIEEHWAARRAARRDTSPADARQTRRHFLSEFPACVRRADGTEMDARIVNLSGIGVFLATPAPEAVGREVRVTLALPYQGHRAPVDLTAIVRWVNDPAAPRASALPPGMGLEFVRCRPASRRLLEQVVGDLQMQVGGTWGL